MGPTKLSKLVDLKALQKKQNLLSLKNLLTKEISPHGDEGMEVYKWPSFPYNRNPLQPQNMKISPFSPIKLDVYKGVFSKEDGFYGKRMNRPFKQFKQLGFEPLTKKTYSTILLDKSSFKNALLEKVQNYFKEEANYQSGKASGHFLLINAGLVFLMVVLGGWTRLTESGLSMVDWKLLHFSPPQTDQEWEEYFEKYKQFPEFKVNNYNMKLNEFKRIYLMEHIHRVLGRITGAFCLLGSLTLFATKNAKIGSPVGKCLVFLNTGMLLQGLMGWVMVKSGLDDSLLDRIPRVYPGYLAIHLTNAFVLYSVSLFWGIRVLINNEKLKGIKSGVKQFSRMASLTHATVFVTAISGALVAGNDAGLVYNSWPMMADRWVPKEIFSMTPWTRNFIENSALVQFNHRHLVRKLTLNNFLAYLSTALISSMFVMSRKLELGFYTKRLVHGMLGMVLIQATLGITTLLYYVPVPLASLHQAGAMILLGLGTAIGAII